MNIKERERLVFNALSDVEPKGRAEIAEALGISSSMAYAVLKSLMDQGLVAESPFRRGREFTYVRIASPGTMPRILPREAEYDLKTGVKKSFPVSAFAEAAPENFDWRFTTPFGESMGAFALLLLDLFTIAEQAKEGQGFDAKAYNLTKENMLAVAQDARWLADVILGVLNHDSLNGSWEEFVEKWTGDPESNLTLAKIRQIQQQILERKANGPTSS